MKKGECPSGAPQPLSTVTGKACKVTVDLAGSDRLYIILVNTGSEQREVTLNIGNGAPRFAITPNPFSGPVGRKLPFAVQAENLPEGVVPEYFWDYGDGVNSGWTSREQVSTLYPRPYESITIIVKVRDKKTGAMLGGASAKGKIVSGPPAGRFTFTMDADPGLYQHSEFGMLKEMVCTVENGRVKGMKSVLLGTRMEGDEKVEMMFNCSLDGTYDALAGAVKGKLSLALQQTRFGPKQDFDRETRQLVTNYVVYRTGARQAADGTLEGTIRPGSGGSGTFNGTYRVSSLKWHRPTGVNSQAVFTAMRPEEAFETVKSFTWPVRLRGK